MGTTTLQLDLESLRTLIAVVDHGGMTRAAKHLNLSQSAVSWKIKRLEEKVGRPLLIRNGHAIRPNRDGQSLIDDGRTMIDLHDRATARLQREELTGRVRLGANEDIDIERLAGVLGRFRRVHPGAVIEYRFGSSEELRHSVDIGELDVVIAQVTDEHLRPDDVVLWRDQLCWTTSRWADHADNPVPLVSYGEHCFYQAIGRPVLGHGGVEWFVSFSGPSTTPVMAAIEAGLGVGLLTSRYLNDSITIWEPGNDLQPLPEINQILRTVPGEDPEVNRALIDVIGRELG